MDYKIVIDSSCDITPQLEERLGAISVPMTMRLGEKEFTDDENLDLPGFISEMKACMEKVSSASPSPFAFQKAIELAKHAFVVTISSQLSGSYSSAELGKKCAEENGITDVHVFDSKSASAGELLLAIKIREMLSRGMPKEQIIKAVNSFISNMKTYFILERYDNLIKNGRLNKVTGKIINALNIKLIMGADSNGSIALYAKSRGTKQMIEKILSFIKSKEKPTSGETMVISHCNNLPLAKQLSDAVKKQFDFKEIIIVPTKGVISLYADDKGIVLAF
ncbi:MAG: DegV family protein [Oscillospiraceae bacterium]|nr:DegV family protein [Oscillospiraceae bacterium]